MTDRIRSCLVVFKDDLREDDAEPILKAILLLRGVVSVEPHVRDHCDYSARAAVREEIRKEFLALWEKLGR